LLQKVYLLLTKIVVINLVWLQLTNTLQKKLDQVRIEKSQLEKLLRDEKDMHSGLTPRLSIHKEPLPDKTPVTVHEEEDR